MEYPLVRSGRRVLNQRVSPRLRRDVVLLFPWLAGALVFLPYAMSPEQRSCDYDPTAANDAAGAAHRSLPGSAGRGKSDFSFALEEERDEHLGRALVCGVAVRKLVAQIALLDRRAVDKVDACEGHGG